jgi:hypothetical protein
VLGEVATITSASAVCLAAVRGCRDSSRVGIWDVAREVARGYWARALERERRTTVLMLRDAPDRAQGPHTASPAESDGT